MTIQLFNSLGRRKEPLNPRTPGRVGIYVCGVTVYDYCHIGHARVMVAFDVIVRHLRARGYQVDYVRNFTDIDDKIIRRAQKNDEPIEALTERFIHAFNEDMAALGVAETEVVEPRATQHIPEMHEIIHTLMEKGLAYASGGDVYYSVDGFKDYGKLSGKNPRDLVSGSRVEVNDLKKNPLDFVLWKGAKPGEPQYDSPWGPGRPGWHIECSAMGCKHLGRAFDIHGGGLDLLFPHHENEIAQSEGAFGADPWVRHWLHNGFVNVVGDDGEREKMSKSLGNFMTIRDLLKAYHGEVIRFFILNSHYRHPLDFSFSLLNSARAGLKRIYSALKSAEELLGTLPSAERITLPGVAEGPLAAEINHFFTSMDDDFNTPQALAVLFEVTKKLNQALAAVDGEKGRETVREYVRVLRGLGAILGIAGSKPDNFNKITVGRQWTLPFAFEEEVKMLGESEINALVTERKAARAAKNWADSDRIRDQLKAAGITLLDRKDGTTSWRRG